jgi:hypothetical protein
VVQKTVSALPTAIARPATCGVATVASGVRPVFSNSRQKPLPLGAGTIRGGVPSMSTSAPVPSVVHIPTIVAQPTIAHLTPLEETELLVSTASVSHSSSGMPNIKKPSEIYHIPINKQKKMAWVESQIKKDQHEAVNPNFRTAFRSTEDACKRLLRYHVFDELDISPWDMEKADENFEIKSAVMISRLVLAPSSLVNFKEF